MKDYILVNYDSRYDILFHVPSHTIMRVKAGETIDYDKISLRLQDKCIRNSEREIVKDEPLNGLIFNTTEQCNLSCTYCMVNKGNYHNDCGKRSIAFEDYDKTYDFLFSNYPKGTSFVCFFGGEPMLKKKEIMYAVQEMEKRFADRNLPAPRYSIITNGTLIDSEILNFMDEYSIYMSVSLDGYDDLHDSARVYIDGKGSYAKIEENLKKIKERGRKFPLYAECTIHKVHLDRAGKDKRKGGYEFVKKIYELGFDAVYVFPVDSKDQEISLENTPYEDLKEFYFGVYEYYMELLLDKDSKQLAPGHFIGIFANILAKRQNRVCNAGVGTIFVNPLGDIYPCHLLYNSKYQKMGNIYEEKIDEQVLNSIYSENNKEKISNCKNCKNRSLCFLWCPGSSMLSNGEIGTVVGTRCKVVDITVQYVLYGFGKIINGNLVGVFKENMKKSITNYKRF